MQDRRVLESSLYQRALEEHFPLMAAYLFIIPFAMSKVLHKHATSAVISISTFWTSSLPNTSADCPMHNFIIAVKVNA